MNGIFSHTVGVILYDYVMSRRTYKEHCEAAVRGQWLAYCSAILPNLTRLHNTTVSSLYIIQQICVEFLYPDLLTMFLCVHHALLRNIYLHGSNFFLRKHNKNDKCLRLFGLFAESCSLGNAIFCCKVRKNISLRVSVLDEQHLTVNEANSPMIWIFFYMCKKMSSHPTKGPSSIWNIYLGFRPFETLICVSPYWELPSSWEFPNHELII